MMVCSVILGGSMASKKGHGSNGVFHDGLFQASHQSRRRLAKRRRQPTRLCFETPMCQLIPASPGIRLGQRLDYHYPPCYLLPRMCHPADQTRYLPPAPTKMLSSWQADKLLVVTPFAINMVAIPAVFTRSVRGLFECRVIVLKNLFEEEEEEFDSKWRG